MKKRDLYYCKMTSVELSSDDKPKPLKKESFFKRKPKTAFFSDLPCQGLPEDLYYFNLNPESFESTVDISVNTDTHKKIRISTLVQHVASNMLPSDIAPFYQTAVAFANNNTPLIQMLKDQQVMYASPVYAKETCKLSGILIGWEFTSKVSCPSPKDFIQVCSSPKSPSKSPSKSLLHRTLTADLLSAVISEASSSEHSYSSCSDESTSQPSPKSKVRNDSFFEV